MINLADKLTAKTVEGILADSNEIKYTKEMGDTSKAETVAKELSNITDSMSGLSNSVTALSQEFETTQSDIEQLLNKAEQYTDRFVDNPIANSENSGLMSADDKTKLDSYPSQFVLDLGLVNSQRVGEQMAARSEVAGNRNISFIRFQVKGADKLKTSLIMQWPNGISETAQIICVDKAQFRRNVTGATGVKGATTNAYNWERIAPQRIVYNASNRKIRLEDYERVLVSDVELPIATPTQHGLLSASDKTKLENYPETPLNISTATDDSPGLMSEVAYKDLYDTKTLAAGNQTKITDLEAKINELGNFDTQHQLLARAAEFDIVSNNSIVFIHGTYKQTEGIYHGVFILQQVEMNNNGGGTSMQYIYIEKRQYTRYISFSPTEVTEVQQVQNHGVRNLSLSGRNLQMTDMWGYNVGIGVTFPDNGNIYEGTPSMSSVPVVLAKTFGGTVATTLSAATSTRAGMMSAADKTKLDKTKPVEEVTWTEQSHMNAYTECGEFHIKGERTNANDGLPILNAASGHTIDATLTVLDSSLSGGTGAKTDACVTQVLRMSNRTGGDGHIYVRTGQGVDKEQLDWGTWEKLMGMFEKNGIDTLEDLDGYTTNGMYSGLYAGTEPKNFYLVRFLPGDTFLMIIVNGYAASPFGTPQITQLLYKLPAKTSTSEQNAEIYLRTGSYNKTDKVWVWGNFIKMATIDDINPTPMISVTYAELVALRDNGELVAGMQYRITDYVTTTAQENTRSAGHQFDVIVTADNENTLNEVARACLHEGDTYFSEAGADLAAWKIWYCIDNDAERFAWADAENGKGVIYRMIDEWNNDVPYDFKNINFKRYIIEANNAFATNAAKGGEIDVVKEMLKDTSHKIHTDLWYYGVYVSNVYPDANPDARYVPFGDVNYENEGPQVLCGIDENNYGWFYTFHNENGDASLLKPNVNENIRVCDNTIKDSCYVFLVEEGTGSYYPTEINAQSLNNIVFLGNSCYSNSFGNDCNSNSFGNDCNSNSFGNSCHSNSFGNDCNFNSFGNYCNSNSFGNSCNSNSFGNSCYSNSFGNYCNSNSFGNDFSSNSFGNGYYSNSFGNNCYSNIFGNYCNSNSFGNDCNSNSFGNDCNSNSFGNSCYSNSFGNDCNSNSFGNDCNSNTFLNGSDVPARNIKYCRYDDGVHNVTMNYDMSNAYKSIMNIHIYRGVHDVSYTPQADTEVEQNFCCNDAGEIVSFRLVDIITKVNGL